MICGCNDEGLASSKFATGDQSFDCGEKLAWSKDWASFNWKQGNYTSPLSSFKRHGAQVMLRVVDHR